MKNLKENISFGASIFTFISAIVSTLAGFVTNSLALGMGLFSIVLLICIIVLQRKLSNTEKKSNHYKFCQKIVEFILLT